MFDPIRIYDKPAVILTQLGNGIATNDSVRRTLFDPAALSPRERQTYVDGLKKSAGNNPVMDTIVDVVSNPLTWLAFISGGAMATKNFAKTGRFFTGGLESAGYGDWVKSKWPFLRSMRLLSAAQELQGTSLPAILERVPQEMKRLQNEFSGYVNKPVQNLLERLSEKHGIKITSLDPSMAPNAAVEYDLQKIRGALHSKLSGYDKETNFKYISGLKPKAYDILTTWTDIDGKEHQEWLNVGDAKTFKRYEKALASGKANYLKVFTNEDGDQEIGDMLTATQYGAIPFGDRLDGSHRAFTIYDPKTGARGDSVLHGGLGIEYHDITRGRLIGNVQKLNSVVSEFGLDELIQSTNNMRTAVRVRLYGDEDHYRSTGEFQADKNKILRIARGAVSDMKNQGIIGKDGRLNYNSASTVNGMMSDEVAGVINDYAKRNPGKGSNARDIENLLVEAYTAMVDDPNYVPRNTNAVYKNVGGAKIEVEPSPFWRPGSFMEGFGRDITPSGRTKFRVRNAPPMDPEDIQFLIDEFGGTPELHQMLKSARKNVFEQARMDVRGHYKVHRMAPDEALQKYIVSSSRDAVMFSDDPLSNGYYLAAIKDFRGPETNVRYPGPTGRISTGGIEGSKKPYLAPLDKRPAGGYSLNDIIQTQMLAIEENVGSDAYVPRAMKNHVLPAVFGYRSVEDGASRAMSEWLRGHVLDLSNSEFFKSVEGMGGAPERFVRSMRRYGSEAPGDSNEFGGGIAKIFYGSTMGLNINTALTNLLQPLHNVHQFGFANSVKAYGQTITQMLDYAKARSELGPGASPSQIEEAMDYAMSRKLAGGVNVKLREISDIGSAWDSVERTGYGSQLTTKSDGLFEWLMKPFQITEMSNRLVTANAVLNAAEAGWVEGGRNSVLDPFRASQEARQAVEMMQFGSSPMNRPLMFYTDYLRNPAIRQFMQFPVRTAVNIMTMPDIVGGSRTVFGNEVERKGWLGTKGIDFMRMLGVSAIAYEVGKDMFGADLSKGLSVGFVPDIDVDKDKSLPIPVPPFADAMYSAVRSVLAGGDQSVMADVVPMIVPGGVALSRALGVLPKMDSLQVLGLQKRYADWSKPDEQGNYPVFDGDGRMMGMYSGSDIVLRAMGTDLGRFNNQGEVTQFLLKNRDQMRDQRRQWISSVLSNNMAQAGKIKSNYERQFGMPLTVTQQQMRQAIDIREGSIASRTMSSMDKDLQQQYKDLLGQSVPDALTKNSFPVEQGAMYVWNKLPKR